MAVPKSIAARLVKSRQKIDHVAANRLVRLTEMHNNLERRREIGKRVINSRVPSLTASRVPIRVLLEISCLNAFIIALIVPIRNLAREVSVLHHFPAIDFTGYFSCRHASPQERLPQWNVSYAATFASRGLCCDSLIVASGSANFRPAT